MNPARHATVAPAPKHASAGITVRPPRVLVVSQQQAASVEAGSDSQRLRHLVEAGGYTRVATPSVVVYRIETGTHRQTGVLLDVSVTDYHHGRIRRHEATRPDRQRRLGELTEAAGFQRMPVTLIHPARDRLRGLLGKICEAEPDVRVTSGDGITHTVWIRADATAARTVQDEVTDLDALYIADGHHRMAAAQERAERGRDAFTFAALFPSDEMRILGYHRCLPLPATVATGDVLEALTTAPAVAGIERLPTAEAPEPAPGAVTLVLDDRRYRLRLRESARSEDLRTSLDVMRVDEELLPAVRAVTGGDGHTRHLGPSESGASVSCWCDRHPAVCFLPHPPTVEQVMAVADAGLTMPPKSTWFDPKARADLVVRELPGLPVAQTRQHT